MCELLGAARPSDGRLARRWQRALRRVRDALGAHTTVLLDVDTGELLGARGGAGARKRPLAHDREAFAALHAERRGALRVGRRRHHRRRRALGGARARRSEPAQARRAAPGHAHAVGRSARANIRSSRPRAARRTAARLACGRSTARLARLLRQRPERTALYGARLGSTGARS